MNNEEKDTDKIEVELPTDAAATTEDDRKIEALNRLQDDIIRNDTIPETKRNTPGSNGAYPIGAFDTSKEYTKE